MKIRIYSGKTFGTSYRPAGSELEVSPATARAECLGAKNADVYDPEEDVWCSPNSAAAKAVIEAGREEAKAKDKARAKKLKAKKNKDEGGLASKTVEQLQDMLRARDLKVSGTKDELIARLTKPEAGDEEE